MNLAVSMIGPYRIERELARGGMGIVYLAHDTRLNRAAAIKALPDDVASDPDRLARFKQEAQVLASLSHQNIAGIYGLEESEGRRYLALEYIEGETLAERIARGGPLPVEEAIDTCLQIAAGVEAAHEGGIIHRDLKPGNVMITSNGGVKVVDFGLAKGKVATGSNPATESSRTLTASPATMPGAVIGTARYLSPEQARGRPVDRRTDIWAFGCVLYECLTGKVAFEGETVSDTIARILVGDVNWGRLPKSTPRRMRELLQRCLEKDASKRLRDIGEARLALEEVKAERGTTAMASNGGGWPKALLLRPLPLGIGLALVVIALALGLNVAGLRDRLWPSAVDARTLLILPIEVRGQVEGADYAGRSFAEEVAMNLARGKGLTILPVPEPGELGEERGMAQVRAARKVRAGLVLTGALSREGEALRARLSLVGTAENRILWGAEEDSREGDLSQLAVILSRKLLSHFGGTGTLMYESHHSETPSPAVMATKEFVEARTGLRNVTAPVQATGWLVERFPDDPLVRVMRADALLQAAWGAPAGSPKRRAFEESLLEIDQVDRNNPWDDFFRAVYYEAHDGKRREAVEELTRLLARDDIAPSGRAQILTFRGQAKADMDDPEGGIADLEEALRLTPAGDFPHLVLGDILAGQQRYKEAWALARQAVALNPTSHQNQDVLGWTGLEMEKWGDALPALEKACQGTPDQWSCAGWAIALWHTGRQEEARRVAQRAASLPETIEGTLDLGIYHAQAGNRSEALRRLHRYLEDKPTFTPRDARYLAEVPLLKPLHGDPDFKAIVAEARRRADSQR